MQKKLSPKDEIVVIMGVCSAGLIMAYTHFTIGSIMHIILASTSLFLSILISFGFYNNIIYYKLTRPISNPIIVNNFSGQKSYLLSYLKNEGIKVMRNFSQ